MSNYKLIAEAQIGSKMVAGTDWPEMAQVYRDTRGMSRPQWVSVVVCNGVAVRPPFIHQTRRAALQWLRRVDNGAAYLRGWSEGIDGRPWLETTSVSVDGDDFESAEQAYQTGLADAGAIN